MIRRKIKISLLRISLLTWLIALTSCSSESVKSRIHFGPGPEEESTEGLRSDNRDNKKLNYNKP